MKCTTLLMTIGLGLVGPLRGAAAAKPQPAAIEGILVNNGELSPIQQWRFIAYIAQRAPGYWIGKTESGALHGATRQSGVTRSITESLHFDPLFDPYMRGEIKKWEKVHGKRQR